MEKINQLIEIVYDKGKRKLRARCIQDGRWVRFPTNLRKENKVFKAGKMKKIGDSHWTASELTEFNLFEKNSEIEEVLGLKNKGVLNKFYENIVSDVKTKKINTEMLNIIFTVKNLLPDINEQLLEPLLQKYSHSAFIEEELLLDAKNMLASYNEKRIVSLFSSYNSDDFLEDTVLMYKHLFQNDVTIDDILPEKPKNIRELHTIFTRESSKIKQPKSLLNQNIDFLDGVSLGDGYSVFVPQTSLDLISIGNNLHICVGNGLYAKKVLQKKCNIISLKKDGKFTHCVEFDSRHLIQCRGRGNANMEKGLVQKLQDLIYKKEPKQKKVA